jgi:formylmethanofuran dehydrogenase subunit C
MTAFNRPYTRNTSAEAGSLAMKAFTTIKRAAAGLAALGAVLVAPAHAETPKLKADGVLQVPPEVLHELVTPERPDPVVPTVIFTKTGQQLSCDYLRYDIRFGIAANADFFAKPAVGNMLQQLRFDFTDQIPSGTQAVSAQLTGDVTGPGGPVVEIKDVADVKDTVEISDFRLTAADLDGNGGPDRRMMHLVITAKINPAAFPAPTQTINQAGITVSVNGSSKILVSHDPALPDDGNPETGEKTKVLVDLTDCDHTPPGGTPPEPCFKLVEGEVLCDPQGFGDFIYKMPVGPEMAGQTVQLVSLTPGITITPDSQIVPPGGGILVWTISGALPGDTIELSVTGVQSFGGPVEGVGICCTQRITIVIPPNLDCPRPGEPDIKVVKVANESYCKREGPCDFTIRVSNAGTAPYNGPIVLEDVTGPGNATVMSGPNAPWTCLPGVSPIMCSHPPTTLNPGQFVDLKLGFKPGPGWQWDAIRNCAEYDYTASGFAHPFGLQSNDKSCASIPICRRGDPRCPDPTKVVDLEIRKVPRTEYCSPAGLCTFVIAIRNAGSTVYSGPLSFRDQVSAPAPAGMSFIPTPPWSCSMLNASTYQCDNPGVVMAPGSTLLVGVRVSAPNYPKDTLENCAKLKQVTNENNLANNASCATIKIRKPHEGNPDLGITKECRPMQSTAAAGQGYVCRITVSNTGTAAPTGTILVGDAATMIGGGAPVQVNGVNPDGPQWTCTPTPANSVSCNLPGPQLPPGATRYFDVFVAGTNGEPARNCARGSTGPVGGDAFVPFGRACADFGGSLRVRKTGDLTCDAGGSCSFQITVSNGTGAPINGPVQIVDALYVNGAISNAPITNVSPPFGCSPEPTALPLNCTAVMSLAPGASSVHNVTVAIPANAGGGKEANGLNCVAVLPSANAGLVQPGLPDRLAAMPQNLPPNVACHPFTVVTAEKVCTPPLVMNDIGRCVCPEGSRFQNGTCVPIIVTPSCKIPGQIVVGDHCECPKGQQVINGACRVPKPVCQIPGQIVVGNHCECPDGQLVINGKCRTPKPVCTIPGQIVVGNHCECPDGQQVINGKCRTPKPVCQIPGQIVVGNHCECPDGQLVINGKCRTPKPVCQIPGQIVVGDHCECPKGTEVINGACRKPQPTCRIPGQIVVNGECTCRKGQVVINGKCQIPQPTCKIPGQVVVGDHCECPKGTEVINGACRKPQPTCRIPGQIVVNGECTCRKGQVVINGKCQIPQPTCKIPGQVVVGDHCECPKGTEVINGACRKPQPTCRIPGQVVINGQCTCRKGQIVINGKCQIPDIRTLPKDLLRKSPVQ